MHILLYVHHMLPKAVLFAHFPKYTPRRARDLEQSFGSIDAAWEAPRHLLQELPWKEDVLHAFVRFRAIVSEHDIEQSLKKHAITPLVREELSYPTNLKTIYDPPPCLFVRGTIPAHAPMLAVVGARKHTRYGKQIAEMLTMAISQRGVSIVSGLALGIDSIAHRAALHAGGRTIAVLGSGIDEPSIHPRLHRSLANDILKTGGAIVSEYPPGTPPAQFRFPERNRIIAGLSQATLVIEAAQTSGALITARAALEMGRDVCAVPHPITSPTGAGANRLLKDGAFLVTEAADVLQFFHLPTAPRYDTNTDHKTAGNGNEACILALLSHEPLSVDEIIAQTHLPPPAVLQALSLLEMKKMIQQNGGVYSIAK